MISTPRTDEVEDSFDGEQECWSTQHVANMAFAHSRTLERELTTLAEMLGDPTDAMIAAAVESGCCNSPVCRKDIFRAMGAEALKSIGCPIPNAGASEVRSGVALPLADENAASAGEGRKGGSNPPHPAIQVADHDQVEREIANSASRIVRDVGELDYDSPEDRPDIMLVTCDELAAIVRDEFRAWLDTHGTRQQGSKDAAESVRAAWAKHAGKSFDQKSPNTTHECPKCKGFVESIEAIAALSSKPDNR